jgi:sortase (surface protein transpeptidase)
MRRRSSGGATRSRALLAFIVPAVLAGGAVLLLSDRSPEGVSPLSTPAQLSAVPRIEAAPAGGESSNVRRVVTGDPAAAAPTESGVQPTEDRPSPPARIQIPDVGIDTTVVPVEATDDGIAVPPVYEAGWFDEGPRPSEPGRAIVLGHLDSLSGPAAFTQLPQARPGSDVIVTDEAGVTHTFRVLRTLEIAKSSFPADEVYGATRRPGLALITCGGKFDSDTGYENNVIVFARELRND